MEENPLQVDEAALEAVPEETPAAHPTGAPLPVRVLVLDDEPITVLALGNLLVQQGYMPLAARSLREATSILAGTVPDVAIVDVYLGTEDGLDLVRELHKRLPDVGIIVISAEDTETLAQKAISCGADAFLSKPIAPAALMLSVRNLLQLRRERQRAVELERELKRSLEGSLFPRILTHSDAMRSVLRLVEKVAPRELSVLIFGESGTGKELVARAVHEHSHRSRGSFVELNCAALPVNLVESELFGHEKGAFTGALASRAGKIEQANGGTLFLDEIGELPLEIQPKFLRALQEKRVTRVGGKGSIDCDFRLVCATNRDLAKDVREGRFREDLFYRIAVFPLKLPPLRDRIEDVDMLLEAFLRQEGIKSPRVTEGAHELLRRYSWPGNVRELKNMAQAVTLLTETGTIDESVIASYLGSRFQLKPGTLSINATAEETPDSVRKLADLEREEILRALRVFRGYVPEAARALGMGRATLYKYIKKHDIRLEIYGGTTEE